MKLNAFCVVISDILHVGTQVCLVHDEHTFFPVGHVEYKSTALSLSPFYCELILFFVESETAL